MWTLLLPLTSLAAPVALGPAIDLDGARERIAEVTGRAPDSLDVQAFGAWSAALPVTFDGGIANGCFGDPVGRDAYEASLRIVESTKIEARPEAFDDLFRRVESELACLDAPVNAGRFFLAKARHAIAAGDATTAQKALRDARAMGATPERLPAELQAAFDAVTPSEVRVPVRLLPWPEAVWVDGERVTPGEEGIALPVGRHLVTLRGSRTTSVDVDVQGPGTLVVPGTYHEGMLDELAVPYRELALAQLVAMSPASSAWLSDGVSVWKATARQVRDLTGPPPADRTIVQRPGDDAVCLPGGTFLMGSDDGPRSERPRHPAYVDPFCILDHPVTQADYLALTGQAPSAHPDCPRCPVENVSWSHAVAYANRLSTVQGLEPAYDKSGQRIEGANGWRLPTEAEWEYAARGGQPHLYAGHNTIATVGWVAVEHPQPVCGKPRNGYGLCDMSGNVREWTDTWSHGYGSGTAVNPTGPRTGHLKITRGGSWSRDGDDATVSFRSMTTPTTVSPEVGFRLVRPR